MVRKVSFAGRQPFLALFKQLNEVMILSAQFASNSQANIFACFIFRGSVHIPEK